MKALLTATILAVATLPAAAEIISKSSPHSVGDTADKLVAAVKNAGAKVFAIVDHAAGAQSVDAELRPTVMVMFGNPKLGTLVMQASQAAGLDLPLRVVIYEDADGAVTVAYHAPTDIAETHGIDATAPVFEKIAGALGKLTDAAVSK